MPSGSLKCKYVISNNNTLLGYFHEITMTFFPQNDTVTMRSSVFMVSNVKWPRNIRRDRQHTHKNNVFKVNQSLQAKLGLTYGSKNGKNWRNVHGNRRLIRSIHVNSDRNRSNQVFVTLRNPNCLQTDQILSALVEVFEPFVKSNPIQVCFVSSACLAVEWE